MNTDFRELLLELNAHDGEHPVTVVILEDAAEHVESGARLAHGRDARATK